MGKQKLVRPHLRRMPHNRKQVRVRGHRRIRRTDIKRRGKGR